MKQQTSIASRPVMLKAGDELVRFSLEDLVFVEADRAYCNLHMVDGRMYNIAHPLAYMEPLLPKEHFVRVNRSYIVNVWHITRKRVNQLFFTDSKGETPIVISENYRHALDDAFTIIG